MLPSSVPKRCVSAQPEDGASRAILCDAGSVVVALEAVDADGDVPSDVWGTDAWIDGAGCETTISGEMMLDEDSDIEPQNAFAIGSTIRGEAEGCTDRGLWAWGLARTTGAVLVRDGTWKDPRAWWLKYRPVGRDGVIYGWGAGAVVPRAKWATMVDVARHPAYRTLRRDVEDYQDRLVHYKGKVSFVDDSGVYVDVTPIGYGLYKDSMLLDLEGRVVAEDVIDFVGFVDGTTDWVDGDIPEINVIAWHRR